MSMDQQCARGNNIGTSNTLDKHMYTNVHVHIICMYTWQNIEFKPYSSEQHTPFCSSLQWLSIGPVPLVSTPGTAREVHVHVGMHIRSLQHMINVTAYMYIAC